MTMRDYCKTYDRLDQGARSRVEDKLERKQIKEVCSTKLNYKKKGEK